MNKTDHPHAVAPSAVASIPASTALALLFLRPVLLFCSFAVLWLMPSASGDPGDNLLWQNVAIVGVDLVSLAVATGILRRHGGTLRGLISPRLADVGWGLLAAVIAIAGFLQPRWWPT